MTGARLGQQTDWVLIFRIMAVVFGASSLMMIIAPTINGVKTGGVGRE